MRSGKLVALEPTSQAYDWRRFGPWFLEPVVAGIPEATEIEPNPKPFISTMDT